MKQGVQTDGTQPEIQGTTVEMVDRPVTARSDGPAWGETSPRWLALDRWSREGRRAPTNGQQQPREQSGGRNIRRRGKAVQSGNDGGSKYGIEEGDEDGATGTPRRDLSKKQKPKQRRGGWGRKGGAGQPQFEEPGLGMGLGPNGVAMSSVQSAAYLTHNLLQTAVSGDFTR